MANVVLIINAFKVPQTLHLVALVHSRANMEAVF